MWKGQQLKLKIQVNGGSKWYHYTVFFDIWNKTNPLIPDEPSLYILTSYRRICV